MSAASKSTGGANSAGQRISNERISIRFLGWPKGNWGLRAYRQQDMHGIPGRYSSAVILAKAGTESKIQP